MNTNKRSHSLKIITDYLKQIKTNKIDENKLNKIEKELLKLLPNLIDIYRKHNYNSTVFRYLKFSGQFILWMRKFKIQDYASKNIERLITNFLKLTNEVDDKYILLKLIIYNNYVKGLGPIKIANKFNLNQSTMINLLKLIKEALNSNTLLKS